MARSHRGASGEPPTILVPLAAPQVPRSTDKTVA
jgi:hypothetical protein